MPTELRFSFSLNNQALGCGRFTGPDSLEIPETPEDLQTLCEKVTIRQQGGEISLTKYLCKTAEDLLASHLAEHILDFLPTITLACQIVHLQAKVAFRINITLNLERTLN